MRVLSRAEIAETARLLASDAFCARLTDLAGAELHRLLPPRDITTLQYSIEFRKFRKDDGTKVNWSLDKAPWASEVMAAMDDNNVREVLVPKPARCGGTVIAENYALKMMQFGPSGDVMWYLAGPGEVSSYADREFKYIFEDHPGVAEKIGSGPSDDKLTLKRVGGHSVELMAMSAKTTTNRQAKLIVFDEPDSYNKKFASNFLEQGRQRQRMVGNQRKIYACAHADIGWSGGIAQGWLQSSRGIYVMPCPCCGEWASPYPTKHWQEVPRFKLHYDKSPERTPIGERLKRAEQSAVMLCPSNGCMIDDVQRVAMIAKGRFMHAGQSLDIKAGIIGDPDTGETMGFWVHVLMVPQVTLPALAKELEGAIEHYERTGKTEKIKQVFVRTFGEVYEGAGETSGLDAASLRKRTKELAVVEESPVGFQMGSAPDEVRFVTASVDVGHNRFDVMLRGWDLQRRSWVIDRLTIRQRRWPDGILRDINTKSVQDDWTVLESQVIDRLIPLASDPTKALPVAVTVIDTGDGNTMWRAYEFARRMDEKRWASWRKVRCIKGVGGNRPSLSPTPSFISKDSDGQRVVPQVTMHTLGVDSLKDDQIDALGVEDGSAGQIYFPTDMPVTAFDEIFNEVKVEGKWVRNGPNETLDLLAYTEAGRQMLEPDRKGRDWREGQSPIWATPVSLAEPEEGGDPAVAAEVKPVVEKKSIFERFDELNR
jgi:phage terminase large subunit GpA-like protein